MEMSESAIEKLSRYKFAKQEYMDNLEKVKGDRSKEHELTLLHSPVLNMLARDVAEQLLEDES